MNKRIKKKHNTKHENRYNIRIYIKKKNRYVTMKRNVLLWYLVMMGWGPGSLHEHDNYVSFKLRTPKYVKIAPKKVLSDILDDTYKTIVNEIWHGDPDVFRKDKIHE